MRERSDVWSLLRVTLPPLGWFACLSFLYSIATLACSLGLFASAEPYLSLGLAVAVILWMAVKATLGIQSSPFLVMVSRGLIGLAIIAVVWLTVPLLILETCDAGMRVERVSPQT